MKILMSSSADALAAALAPYTRTATVEAEYGDRVVEGTVVTLAHHGPRKSEPCPCSDEAEERLRRRFFWGPHVEAIGLSHLDLDALGGVAALIGKRPSDRYFWRAAELVDVRGPHRLDAILREVRGWAYSCAGAYYHAECEGMGIVPDDASETESASRSAARVEEHVRRSLQAWWAWSRDHRVVAPRDGVADVTVQVMEALGVLRDLLDVYGSMASDEYKARAARRKALLAAGDRLAADDAAIDAHSWVRAEGAVAVRVSDQFVNMLYNRAGKEYRAVAAFNTATGAVTLSLAEPVAGVSCRSIVQALWGPEAGGHDGIAGSPRGRVMTRDDLDQAARAISEVLR